MCTVSAPPPLAPAWPWQAHGSWLAFVVVFAVPAFMFCIYLVKGLRPQPSVVRRLLGAALALPAALCFLAGLFLIFAVAEPTDEALWIWEGQQVQVLRARGCPAELWQAPLDRASQAIREVHTLGLNLWVVGFILFMTATVVCLLELDAAGARTH